VLLLLRLFIQRKKKSNGTIFHHKDDMKNCVVSGLLYPMFYRFKNGEQHGNNMEVISVLKNGYPNKNLSEVYTKSVVQ
jgi:hypothetical protein